MSGTTVTVPTRANATIEVYTHTADLVPSLIAGNPISDAHIAIIASCLSVCVFAILGVWYLRLRRREAPPHSGLGTEHIGREVPSLRSEVLEMLTRRYLWRRWRRLRRWWRLREDGGESIFFRTSGDRKNKPANANAWKADMTTNDSERAMSYYESTAPNLYGVKITHSEVDIGIAVSHLMESGESVHMGKVRRIEFTPSSAGHGNEVDELDDCDTDSSWTLGEEWRYVHPHPGRRII